jgi:hypothetical protein
MPLLRDLRLIVVGTPVATARRAQMQLAAEALLGGTDACT